ncbi:hypothetical protein BT96DRAFT_991271 [Gymnopus androsaceus JB14]|uniref:Uncharacterized protein n=1 Tax=Gymnopus androsaceus JB14 TaxID=1447944 RepID=A0A6A4HVR9_9AGAR|nr:hypothetical protein BT96DRAFT_991271 [Gymnopus androsaceus JB14]
MARVDPHLTFGCEVALDVDLALLGELEQVQHLFLRRLLSLHRRSILVVFFSETGLIPIRYRRIGLALGFLSYLLGLPMTHLAKAALENAFSLASHGHSSWINNLIIILARLPVTVVCTLNDLRDPKRIERLTDQVMQSCEASIQISLETQNGTVLLFHVNGGYVGSVKRVSKMNAMPYSHAKGTALCYIFAIAS